MSSHATLAPASELALKNGAHYPNESEEYRNARNALLAEEIELRRHIERVAEQRRALPLGGRVTAPYKFEGENGHGDFASLFGDKQTLIVYSYMFGPQRKRPCPMCTSLLSAWDGEAKDVDQRASLAIVARSPIDRLLAFKEERRWTGLKLYTDLTGEYSRDYVSAEGDDDAAINVFTRRDGVIHHFWSGEMGGKTADPGQDPRGAPDLMPLWNILDMTPEGRGSNWYPKLDYEN
ncbi:DUF899 family protein [Phyllobacterium sp. YR531]|uniref:DUF899 family protein n=1 Tax=Phyllobacterium sp. YR531 TaxID=1144343 RepID=UPI00026F4A05|nr:DUF899 family protein [Phyllobacterium sp. YR531]EJM98664.1 hypothetical protein PMI41_04424 [Phyllobacterium sp. YR531]